jgi:hypothetical protein
MLLQHVISRDFAKHNSQLCIKTDLSMFTQAIVKKCETRKQHTSSIVSTDRVLVRAGKRDSTRAEILRMFEFRIGSDIDIANE